MKRITPILGLVLSLAFGLNCTVLAQRRGGGSVTVRGYYRNNGTYVTPHHRSAPDGNFYNNWSTKGNINPFTGQPGRRVTPPARTPYIYPPVYVTPSVGATETIPATIPPRHQGPLPLGSRTTPILPPVRAWSAEEYSEEGLRLFKNKSYADAIAPLRVAVRLKPCDPYTVYALGVCLTLADRDDEAIDFLNRAVELKPLSPSPHIYLGLAYQTVGDSFKAIAEFKMAVRLGPQLSTTHLGLALAYKSLGHYGRAVRPLKEAIRVHPNEAFSHYHLGEVFLLVGKKDLAWREYEVIRKLDADLARKLYLMQCN